MSIPNRVPVLFRILLLASFLPVPGLVAQVAPSPCDDTKTGLVLARSARNWQFLDAVGPQAGIFGREDGTLEAWVFPLKLFRDFHLLFHANDRVIPADSLPRTVIARPESTSIRYEYNAESATFSVCETLFVPADQRGAVILLQADSLDPLTIEANFAPDVAWMWPAGMGDAFSRWNKDAKVFEFGEDQHRFFAIAGGPGISNANLAYSDDYATVQTTSFSFPPLTKGTATYTFAIAASFDASNNEQQAKATYTALLSNVSELRHQAAAKYGKYLDDTVSLALPDHDLQDAYDWARIATVLGVVDEPFAGHGLVAGYGISGLGHRPGFGWFFGRDSMWTALALDSIGDFANTKAALQFLASYQRPNGKIPHEIPQSIKLTDWFNEYVYGTASADGTPLYIIGMADYVRASGDLAFAGEKWESLWKAYQFLHSTYAPNGLPLNKGVGHGWIEGGALLPVSSELYQSGVSVAALQALSELAKLLGKSDVAQSLKSEASLQNSAIESLYWSPEQTFYAYALNVDGQRINKPSVLGTVPMWFGLLNQERAEQYLNVLASPDHQADWGMRIISEKDPLYYPVGYHFGSVWPLFTGWASVAEYRYHRPLPAYLNLRANAQMVYDGALGRATEVLSGRYYTPLVTSSSHQIWSSAMIISPILRGMMGLQVDTPSRSLTLAPHVPAGWSNFDIKNVTVGGSKLDLSYTRGNDEVTLKVTRHGSDAVQLQFSPAFSPRAKIVGAMVDGRAVAIKSPTADTVTDQHPTITVALGSNTTTIRMRYRDDFEIGYPYAVPVNGAFSTNVKFVSEEWNANRDRLTLQVAGSGGARYRIPIYGDTANTQSNGAEISADGANKFLLLTFPPGPSDQFTTQTVVLTFAKR